MATSTKFPPGTHVYYTSNGIRRRGVVAPYDHPAIKNTPTYANPRVWAFWNGSANPTHTDERITHAVENLITGTLHVAIKKGELHYSHLPFDDTYEVIASKPWDYENAGK